MTYELDDRWVLGVASSALFDLAESDAYFREHGEAKYRVYQDERRDDTVQRGVAFLFIQRLLKLNDLRLDDPRVEVSILSHNDPMTGLRVMPSVRTRGLPITRCVFTHGEAPCAYFGAFGMSLFPIANRGNVDPAIKAGLPAGQVYPSSATYDPDDPSLCVAFDFDGVLASDESEWVYKNAEGIEKYFEHEDSHSHMPLAPALLKPFLADPNRIQTLEEQRKASGPSYEPRLRISLTTARNAAAHERASTRCARRCERERRILPRRLRVGEGTPSPSPARLLRRPAASRHRDRAHRRDAHPTYGVANVVRSAERSASNAGVAFPPLDGGKAATIDSRGSHEHV